MRLGAGSTVVYAGDTDNETSETRAGMDNKTDNGKGIGSDAVTGYCGEKYETDSRNVTFADTKYFMLMGL